MVECVVEVCTKTFILSSLDRYQWNQNHWILQWNLYMKVVFVVQNQESVSSCGIRLQFTWCLVEAFDWVFGFVQSVARTHLARLSKLYHSFLALHGWLFILYHFNAVKYTWNALLAYVIWPYRSSIGLVPYACSNLPGFDAAHVWCPPPPPKSSVLYKYREFSIIWHVY